VHGEISQLLGQRRFVEADALAQKALSDAQESGSTEREVEALSLLINSAIFQHRITDDTTKRWVDRALALSESAFRPGLKAKLLAVEAARENVLVIDNESYLKASADILTSIQLDDQARDGLDVVDRAYIYQVYGEILIAGGKLAAAETAKKKAVSILAAAGSKGAYEKSVLALVTGGLGSLQQQLGELEEAKKNINTGMQIAAKTFGRRSTVYATAVVNHGTFQLFQGDFLAARRTFEGALEILRNVRGEEYTVASIHTYLGSILTQLGDYDGAKMLLKQTMSSSTGDAAYRFRTNLLNNLAIAEIGSGDDKAAVEFLEQSIALDERRYGSNTPRVAVPLFNLVEAEIRLNDWAAAERTLNRLEQASTSKQISSFIGGVKEFRGLLALSHGQLSDASSQFEEAIGLIERNSKVDPAVITPQCFQGLAEARLGRFENAYALVHEGESSRLNMLQYVLPALPGERATKFKETWDGCLGLLLVLAEQSHSAEEISEAWRIASSTRQLGTRLEAVRLESARQAVSGQRREDFLRWQTAAENYSDALLNSASSESTVLAAMKEFENAEKAIPAQNRTAHQDLDQLVLRLPNEMTLVAYVDAEWPDISPNSTTVSNHRHALFAFVRDRGSTRLTLLGDGEQINQAVRKWYALLRDPQSAEAEITTAGRKVRKMILDPLGLGEKGRRVLVVPSGPVFLVNFAALPDDSGAFLVERDWRVQLLDVESDLLLASDRVEAPKQLLVLGAPQFDSKSRSPQGADLCSRGFSYLPGAEEEISDIARLWNDVSRQKPVILKGKEATKAAFRLSAPNADIVHIATHAVDLNFCGRATSYRGIGPEEAEKKKVVKQSEGVLALSGANDYFVSGDTRGILSSEEVATMNLGHTQLVVLSACDTGLGELTLDEGIFGLRRSFRLAGARTLVMSLWGVDDVTSQEWMERLYKSRLIEGKSTPDAIASAQLGVLESRRALGLSTLPFYWAPFVASGDWR
jgi:CHAT domain-containing protein